MTTRANDAAFRAKLMTAVERGLGREGAFTQGAIPRKIRRSQPIRRSASGRTYGLDPSKPGEPPKQVTTELKESIAWEVETDASGIALRIGTNIPYGRYLEQGTSKMAARPYLRSTLEERLERIKRGVAKAIREAFPG